VSILAKIAEYKRREIAEAKRARPPARVEQAARGTAPRRGFLKALEAAKSQNKTGLIAEIKRASPSRGLIRADFDVPALAKAYAEGGAACLSVLTDGPSFEGDLAFLAQARGASPLPVLRKDFMFEAYQVAEARAAGADCILIIMAMVSADEAAWLIAAAKSFGMDWLIEVHNETELDAALALDSPLIGINNRDLNTFVTDLGTTKRLAPRIPKDRIVVSESGIFTPADVVTLASAGVTTLLVGESLMREADVSAATRRLLAPAAA
jgi:indole-3-glycerol phosphate synthase